MNLYDKSYFERLQRESKYIKTAIPKYIKKYQPKSLVDFGCGSGQALVAGYKLGLVVRGYDISRFAKMSAPQHIQSFIQVRDVTKHITTGKFDLVISLETGEHIEPSGSEQFVRNLVQAGDIILFSAAPHGQGGTGHINLQPKQFWIELFNQWGYELDLPHTYEVKELWTESPDYIQNNLMLLKCVVPK